MKHRNDILASKRRMVPLLVALMAIGSMRAAHATAVFEFLGDLPGGSRYAEALGVSADGSFVVGESSSALSGVMSPNVGENATEGFIWDASTQSMIGVGDLPGGRFSSRAVAVSADGRFVVGSSEETSTSAADPVRSVPFHWKRDRSPRMVALVNSSEFPHFMFQEPAISAFATATSISDDGATLVGTVTWLNANTLEEVSRGFYTTPLKLTFTFLDVLPAQNTAPAISPDGKTIVGSFAGSGSPTNGFRLPLIGGIVSGPMEDLGKIGNATTRPTAVSADGKTIAGDFLTPTGSRGTFLYTETVGQPTYAELRSDNTKALGISASGRILLDSSGGLYLDGHGPFDLRQILAEAGALNLQSVPADLFRARAISRSGFVIVGGVFLNGVNQAWRARLSDCDANGLPDELEQLVYAGDTTGEISRGSERFAASREVLGYGDMVSQYGRPWKAGTGRTPGRDGTDPAELLRAALRLEGCFASVPTQLAAQRFIDVIGFPAVNEINAFEMLLGNEALADALDPTIGLDGISSDGLGDQLAFRGVPGIQDLVDEELALLRGRDLPGSPADWLSETTYYPELTGPEDAKRRIAIYNRLPPNASSANGVAYRSNYRVADNFEAAEKFPQGHGDAYGYFLGALKTGLTFLKNGPLGWPEQYLPEIAERLTSTGNGLDLIRRMAEASAARARSAAEVADLLYRRDYQENPSSPRSQELFVDPDPQRAWSMGEWAIRGALGAYLDWAVLAHLAPTDEAKEVRRDNLPELDELAGAIGNFQERLDSAGAGLDPLGLLQNVVPFGIDASGLQPGSGRSHYEQVRDAASRALENARKAFEVANQAGQRLRDSDKTLTEFTNRLEDTRVDHDQRLIEIFGLPSPNDPENNDLDSNTNDFVESQSHPDLTNFLATDEGLAAAGMGPRLAPGQVQLALSELRVAALRVEQAELAVDDLAAQITSQVDRIALLQEVRIDRIKIVTRSRDDQIALTDRMEQISARRKQAGLFGSFVKSVIAGAAGDPGALIDLASQIVTETADAIMTATEGEKLNNEFDIERERTRIQAWKEIELQGLDDRVAIDAETRALKALIRKTPTALVDVSVARELASQSFGRLRQSLERGRSIYREKKRLEARSEGDLLEQRWRDMSFRIFRNASLKSFRALFDIAARYVVLAARAYAYEFDARSDGDDVLAGIYRERRLGSAVGLNGGLQGVLNRLDGAITVNNFNRPLETLGQRSFSLRRNLLGIGADDFPNDDLKFRGYLESQIVDRLEDIAEITELAQVSIDRDYGPAIVVTFSSEIDSRNFFGRGPELPFGNSNFSVTRNAKIRSYAIRLDGVDASLGTDPESGTVFAYLLPAGDSVLRENTNKPRVEDELITPWAVVDQFLPPPPLASSADFSKRSYNPWRSAAQVGGNYLNEIKRQRDSEAQIELGQSDSNTRFNTNLAGRSAWNTRWLLIIPGSQWTSSSDTAEIREKLLQLIYGAQADPAQHVGITDIRLIIQAYSH